LREDPFLVCYDYTAEPHPYAAQPPGQPQYSGYNDSAKAAFRDYLSKKFGAISALNSEWGAAYESFGVIDPPPDPYLVPPAKATALAYEFNRFRCDSHAQLWKTAYDAYRRFDQAKPIVANAGMFMGGWPMEGLDSWQLQKTGVADWIDMHMNNFPPNLAEQIYLYSLCRLSGKVPTQFEYVWTFPRTGPVDDASESDFRATCEASVWRNLVWGKKVMVFFDFYYDWPAYHNAFLDKEAGYSILRPSGCVVAMTKRRALRFNDILMHTEVATPPIIVIEPTTSVLNSPAMHPNQSFSFHTGKAGKDVHNLLFPKNYPFLYVPEQAILDGYDLHQHKVVILPEAPYLPEIMTARLSEWVRSGGTLISFGVPGVWNPYGKDDLHLINEAFGRSSVRDVDPGKWKWEWQILQANTRIEWQLRGTNEAVSCAVARFGKGRILVCAISSFGSEELRTRFYETVDKAIGARPAFGEKDTFELVLREDGQKRLFLSALNPHTREIRTDKISVRGQFLHPVDLGVGSGVPLPVRQNGGVTTFSLRLNPGESTMISLRN